MSYKSNKSYTTYIKTFNFTATDWKNIPKDFLENKPNDLNLGEDLQYEGIKMAYFIENKNTRIKGLIIRGTLSATTGTFAVIFAVCCTYYLNLNLNLGLTFLTDFFA